MPGLTIIALVHLVSTIRGMCNAGGAHLVALKRDIVWPVTMKYWRESFSESVESSTRDYTNYLSKLDKIILYASPYITSAMPHKMVQHFIGLLCHKCVHFRPLAIGIEDIIIIIVTCVIVSRTPTLRQVEVTHLPLLETQEESSHTAQPKIRLNNLIWRPDLRHLFVSPLLFRKNCRSYLYRPVPYSLGLRGKRNFSEINGQEHGIYQTGLMNSSKDLRANTVELRAKVEPSKVGAGFCMHAC